MNSGYVNGIDMGGRPLMVQNAGRHHKTKIHHQKHHQAGQHEEAMKTS